MGSGQENDCHNIDECKLEIDNCGEKGDKGTYCRDNDGSFDCFCLPGFHMAESGRCENTNECLEGLVEGYSKTLVYRFALNLSSDH